MPYIAQERRPAIDNAVSQLPEDMTVGDLNYTITRILDREIKLKGLSYTVCNNLLGMIYCVGQEFYRRVVTPYEEKKIAENGDAYDGNAGRP